VTPTRLGLEALDDRALPAVTFHGGAVLPHVQVETVYLGQVWNDPNQLQPEARRLDNFFRDITNSPYMDMLSEYGVGRGQFIGTRTLTNAVAEGVSADWQIGWLLNSEISAWNLTAPNPNTLYVVFTPPGHSITDGNGQNSVNNFYAYHSSVENDWLSVGTSTHINYVVMPDMGYPNSTIPGLTVFQTLTEAASHELAEAVTDPYYVPPSWPRPAQGGWYDDYSRDSTGALDYKEIGDEVNLQYGNWNGYVVQREWSNNAGTGVLPYTASLLNYTAVPTGGSLKTVVAGRAETFGLDGNNEVWAYRNGGWVDTHGGAQDLVVGTDVLGQDELWVRAGDNGVWRYDQGQWGFTGGYLKTIAAGHGEVFGLDGGSGVWVYRDAGGWTNTQGHALSVSLGTDGRGRDELWVVGLDQGVWRYDQGQWGFTGGYLKTIAAGHDGEVFGLDGGNAVWVYRDAGGWTNTLGFAQSLSVGSDQIGLDELWVIGFNQGVYAYDQNRWLFTGGYLQTVVGGTNGRAFGVNAGGELYGYDPANSSPWHDYQRTAVAVSVGANARGGDQLWFRDANNQVSSFGWAGNA
jgi:hypothetical protein